MRGQSDRGRPTRICCVISSLRAGGAERVMSLLANRWATQGRDIAIVTLSSTSSDEYRLDPRVTRVGLDLEVTSRSMAEAITRNARKVGGLRRAVISIAPDVVVSFVDKVNVLTLLACAGLRLPVIVSERVHPGHYAIGSVWSLLRHFTYRFADALVVQCEAIRVWGEGVVPRSRIKVIPNPVGEQFSSREDDTHAARKPVVLAVGRLTQQKGFDLLIKAFRVVVARHPTWSLVIVGRGPQEAELKDLAQRLLPPSSTAFPGSVNDLERRYREAGLFVLPSRFEGFPNALLEAMASGCAVIATDCPGGTSEIVQDGRNGVLVPPENVEALAEQMDRLITDAAGRGTLGARAAEVSSRFRTDRIVALWDGVITQCVGSGR